LICLGTGSGWAQRLTVSGTVTDGSTGQPVGQASVAVPEWGVTVVTNDDGYFVLKTDSCPREIVVSHVGYNSRRWSLSDGATSRLKIRLQPAVVSLKEVVVFNEEPRALVEAAIRKIPQNYSNRPERYSCFYRETAMKRQHFISVAEGVVDMYKTAYRKGGGSSRDKVAIRKGRRLLSPKQSDTLSVKVLGGPVQSVILDIVKNTDFLLNPADLDCYNMKMELPVSINDRSQYVVSIEPARAMPYPLYYGKLYIERETLAFTRAELSLDMSDRDKATRFMLVSKPAGVRFRPKELSSLVDYRYEQGVTRISYISNTFRFNCDWKRRLFATSFTARCEMVVTSREDKNADPISGRQSFDSRDAFFDKVDYFRDPDFWNDYNIIEPTESLDRAIERIVRKYK
jgi:hypothetical protein